MSENPRGEAIHPVDEVAIDNSEVEVTHAGFAVQAADTGRVLLIQRSLDQDDPPDVIGTWEFPGGGLEGDEDPQTAAIREFNEETGLPVPPGEVTGGWRSPDGIYQGFVWTTPVEATAFPELNPDLAAAELVNPDDPERRNPDVSAWFTLEQILNLGTALRPEVYTTDWSQFASEETDMADPTGPTTEPIVASTPTITYTSDDIVMVGGAQASYAITPEEEEPVESPATEEPTDPEDVEEEVDEYGGLIPWHGVMAVENHRSGDGRGMRNLSQRPLPLPMSWQKTSAPGHNGSVVTHRIDALTRVGKEIRGSGVTLPNKEADEFLGMASHFPRFGVSIDADSTDLTFAYEDEETGTQWFENGRIASASVLPIPAFAEAWVSLGAPPEGFMDGTPLEEAAWENDEALVASAGVDFMEFQIEQFKRGPGWVTNPEDTRRLHDYWTKPGQEGYEKVAWGTPGDFNRCRILIGKELTKHSPDTLRYLNAICAQWHYDAIKYWPGRAPSEQAGLEPTTVAPPAGVSSFHLVERDEVESLTAAAGLVAPAPWFRNPEFAPGDGRMVQDPRDGSWGCPNHVTEEGETFGHVAKFTTCHTGYKGVCKSAPRSNTGYGYFMLGRVLTTEGMVPCGSLTIGGGHAGQRLSMRQAMAHYDNSTSVWADVAVGEDEFGIWYHGWVRPGTTPEQVVAARASKISGDWRPVGGPDLELMAALCVNMPGFPIATAHVAAGLQTSLVAAGVVVGEPEPVHTNGLQTPEEFADLVIAAMERRQADKLEQAALLARFPDTAAADQAALLARFE